MANKTDSRLEALLDELRAMGIDDERVLDAMKDTKRELFVPEHLESEAYANYPLPLSHGQTISQPYTVAFMLEQLKLEPGQKVLEVGAGSGWNAALIARLVRPRGIVIATEIISELALNAEANLKRAGISNVKVVCADGSLGYEKEAPYDRIIVTAACPKVPKPLIEQLADNGILIAPVGSGIFGQDMVRLVKRGDNLESDSLGRFVFVPLRGEHGV